jgi:uncharacterized protein YkwD
VPSVALLVAFCSLLAPASGLAARPCPNAYAMPNGHNAKLIDVATLCLMNRLRAAHGVRPLRLNRSLTKIASGQARDMVDGHYFADHSLSGRTAFSRVLTSRYVAHLPRLRLLTAQNIGWGTGPNATPAGIVLAWMQSAPHRHIMLAGAYRDAGVGVSPSVPTGISQWLGGTYAVEFGTRKR